jgi:hypothetical protein
MEVKLRQRCTVLFWLKKQSCFSIAATWVVSRELPREAVKARVQLADYQN